MSFSIYRSSDDRFSSCLLRAVAQLRSQLRAHLPQVPPASRRSPSVWCWVGGTLVVPAVLWQHPRLCLIALCEAEGSPRAHPTPSALELRFNWKFFWHFLHPHLLALGVAIVVRLSLFLHVQAKKGLGSSKRVSQGQRIPALWRQQGLLPGLWGIRMTCARGPSLWDMRTREAGGPNSNSQRDACFCDHMSSPSVDKTRLRKGRGKVKVRAGEGRIWSPLQVSVPSVPIPAGLGCGTSERADPPAPGPAGGDRGQVHEGPRGEFHVRVPQAQYPAAATLRCSGTALPIGGPGARSSLPGASLSAGLSFRDC